MARPRSRVRPLETPGNRRPREMTVGSRQRLSQDPAYTPSLAHFSFAILLSQVLRAMVNVMDRLDRER